MNRRILFFLCLTASWAFAEQATAPKVVVIPFASLGSGVPAKAGTKAAGMLATELSNLEKAEVLEFKRPAVADVTSAPLDKARAHLAEAVKFRAARKFRLAEEAVKAALVEFQQGAGGLLDIAEYSDAWVLLSAVQYNTGQDEEGIKSLQKALAMSPSRDVPLAKTSPLFSKLVEETRKQILKGAKGSAFLESSPAGASIVFDGMTVGATPLSLLEIPVGVHTYRMALSPVETVGGVIEISASKSTKVMVKTAQQTPETQLQIQLAQNKLDSETLESLKKFAQSLQADSVVFGAISAEGNGLGLDALVYTAATANVRRVPHTQFDKDLLSAGVEFLALAGKILEGGDALGAVVQLPASVSSQKANLAKASEVTYDVTHGKGNALESLEPAWVPTDDSGARKPLKRTPLKKN